MEFSIYTYIFCIHFYLLVWLLHTPALYLTIYNYITDIVILYYVQRYLLEFYFILQNIRPSPGPLSGVFFLVRLDICL